MRKSFQIQNNQTIKATYEEIFKHADFDYEGKECDIEGYSDLKETEDWIDLEHSANFELRWCWVARTAIINIVDNQVSAVVCQNVAEFGKDPKNRVAFGKFLDRVRLFEVKENFEKKKGPT